MKLKMWIAHQDEDHPCFNLVSTTKKGLKEQMASVGGTRWEGIYHVEIEAASMFELFDLVTSELGGRHPYSYKILKKIALNTEESEG